MLLVLASFGARADVVINEVLPNPAGADSGFEWIEIVNNGAAAVDLTDWVIERATGVFFSIKYTFPIVTINPGERLVIGEEFVAGADFNLAAGAFFAFGNATLSGDGIHLCDENFNIMDTLVYGPNNSDGYLDDSGGLALPAPGPLEDESSAAFPTESTPTTAAWTSSRTRRPPPATTTRSCLRSVRRSPAPTRGWPARTTPGISAARRLSPT